MLRLLIGVVVFGGLVTAGCTKDGPDGYSVAELEALGVVTLLPPDGEAVRRTDDEGSRIGPVSTSIRIVARTHLSAEEVFQFYDAELRARGWVGQRTLILQGASLLEAGWDKDDFGMFLDVYDKSMFRETSYWDGGWETAYRLTLVAEGVKDE